MANPEHLAILRQGVKVWNDWREANPEFQADLSRAHLPRTNLSGADLRRAKLDAAFLRRAKLDAAFLRGADLSWADLRRADLSGADLSEANLIAAKLIEANLSGADLSEAHLSGANLSGANLIKANLSGAELSGAHLSGAVCSQADFTRAVLVRTNLESADLTNATIFGISAWDVQLDNTVQRDLIITPNDASSTITVDDLEVAQFIYLLLNNKRVRKVIDTITSKVVLILGRFSPERKAVLDAVREELRHRDYLPVLFDFEKPSTQTTMDTVLTLAGMARFVIADVTDPQSVLQELQGIVPSRPRLPIQPILLTGQPEPPMFDYIKAFPSVLGTQYYETTSELLANLAERVIGPAERRLASAKGVGSSRQRLSSE